MVSSSIAYFPLKCTIRKSKEYYDIRCGNGISDLNTLSNAPSLAEMINFATTNGSIPLPGMMLVFIV